MALGIYIHIPYCIQRCTYCDFATYEQHSIMPPLSYVALLKEEMAQKSEYFRPQLLHSVYFGGGTPSLIPAEFIIELIQELAKWGYQTGPNTEVTLEVNPATLSEEKLSLYRSGGINRFSVGAQSFDDRLLKSVHREHNAQQTIETLELLSAYNYNFDLLFALPGQNITGLQRDLDIAMKQKASHISPYCLTVPKGHPLSKNRPPEDEQVAMFQLIQSSLEKNGFAQYEISNFAKPGFESKHNLLYWQDEEYWGIGLSAHSYSKSSSWGTRFWNHNNIKDYEKQILSHKGQKFSAPDLQLDPSQYETLQLNQALTDFCHTSLRLKRGLRLEDLKIKFPAKILGKIMERIDKLVLNNSLQLQNNSARLTDKGLLISNLVFEEMTFLTEDLVHAAPLEEAPI